ASEEEREQHQRGRDAGTCIQSALEFQALSGHGRERADLHTTARGRLLLVAQRLLPEPGLKGRERVAVLAGMPELHQSRTARIADLNGPRSLRINQLVLIRRERGARPKLELLLEVRRDIPIQVLNPGVMLPEIHVALLKPPEETS